MSTRLGLDDEPRRRRREPFFPPGFKLFTVVLAVVAGSCWSRLADTYPTPAPVTTSIPGAQP